MVVGESSFHNQGKDPIGGVHYYESTESLDQADFLVKQTLLQKNRTPFSSFGSTVALSQDGQTLAIGAIYQNHKKEMAVGRVYVYRLVTKHNQSVWKLREELIPHTTYNRALFGSSISVLQNGDLIVVGAPGTYSGSGRIYFFQKQTEDYWKQVRDITTMDTYNETYFGASLSGSEDGTTIAVGSNHGNRVFIFRYDEKTWVEERLMVYAYGPAPGRNIFVLNRNTDRWDKTVLPGHSYGSDKAGMVVKVSSDGRRLVAVTRTVLPDVDNIIGFTAVRDPITDEWVQIKPMALPIETEKYAGTIYLTLTARSDMSEIAIGVCTGDFIQDSKFKSKPNGVYLYRLNETQWLNCGVIRPPQEDNYRLFGFAMCYQDNTNRLYIANPMANAKTHNDQGAIYLANTTFVK